MPGQGEEKYSPRRIAAKAKLKKALQLKSMGLSYADVASRAGYSSASAAYRAIDRAFKQSLQPPTERLRKQELERLDRWQARVEKVLSSKHVFISQGKIVLDGNKKLDDDGPILDAVRTLIVISARRAKLLGLDAPVKVAPTNPEGTEPYDSGLAESIARRLLPELAGHDPDGPAGKAE